MIKNERVELFCSCGNPVEADDYGICPSCWVALFDKELKEELSQPKTYPANVVFFEPKLPF